MMKSKQKSAKAGPKITGGSKGMAGKSGAAPAMPGKVTCGGRGGDNSFKAKGGKASMAGFTGAQNARAR
jgi:hypothetical protein